MTPAGTSMVAMYRSLQNDRATLYELLAIEEDGGSLMLRIKHFGPGQGLPGREAKEEAIEHALVRVEGKTAVFEGTGADNPSLARATAKRGGPSPAPSPGDD